MASTSPSRSCRCASAITRIPASRAAAVVWGPIETAGMPAPSAPKARAAEAEASTTTIAGRRRRTQLGRPVERQEVRAELVDDERAGALRGGEEHAPGRSRQLGEQAFLRRDHGYEIHDDPGPRERRGRPRADRRDTPGASARPRHQLVCAVRACDDEPVVPGQVDRAPADRVDADEGAEHDLVAQLGDA